MCCANGCFGYLSLRFQRASLNDTKFLVTFCGREWYSCRSYLQTMFFTIYGTMLLIVLRLFLVHMPKREWFDFYQLNQILVENQTNTEALFKSKIKMKVDKYCNGTMHTAFLAKSLFLIYAESTKINNFR